MTTEKAKKILESHFTLHTKVLCCEHVIELIREVRDLTPSVRLFFDETVLDRAAYIREQERIRKAIDRIPDEQHRKLLYLRFIKRLTWEKIARELWLANTAVVIRKAGKSYQIFAEQWETVAQAEP